MTKTNPTKPAPVRRRAKPTTTDNAGRPAKPRAAKSSRPKARKPDIIRRKLVWREALIAIQYKPGDAFGYAHLELRVVAPKDMPIPATNTGYRSDYVYPILVRNAGGVVGYVRRWLDREAGNKAYLRALDEWRQLDLFAEPPSHLAGRRDLG